MKDPRLSGKKCIVLVRCSTIGQADTSIQDQLRAIDAFIIEHGMIKVGERRLEGVSASIARNIDDVIQSLIEEKLAGQAIDVILVYDLTRLSRVGAGHAGKLRYDLEEVGIEIVSVLGYTPRTDFSELKDAFEATSARQQAKSIAAGAARGSQSALEQGRKAHCAAPPYGLDKLIISADGRPLHVIRNLPDGTQARLDHRTGEVLDRYGRNEQTGAPRHYRKNKEEKVRLIPGDPTRMQTVVRMFRHLMDGWGYWRIAKALNTDGVPAPRGGRWTLHTVKTILDNSVYTGLGLANRTTSGIYYCRDKDMPREQRAHRRTTSGRPAERLRPEADWVRVEYPELQGFLPEGVRQFAMTRHQRIPFNQAEGRERLPKHKHVDSEYLLTDILKTRDGLAMSGRRRGRKNNHRYYCVKSETYAPGPNAKARRGVPCEPIEALVLDQARTMLLSVPDLRGVLITETRRFAATAGGSDEERARISSDLARIDRKIEFTIDELDGGTAADVLKRKLNSLRAQRAALSTREAQLAPRHEMDEREIEEVADAIIAMLQSQGSLLDELPRPMMREFLSAMIERLTVDLAAGEVELVIGLPSWPLVPMGVGCPSACKAAVEAHRAWLNRKAVRFTLPRRRAA
jgi:DNA invertase Pin-like site-specific DNA recombinase